MELEGAIGREHAARVRGDAPRRRLVALVVAAVVVVIGTAAAYGTVRHFFTGPTGSTFDSPVWSQDGRIYALRYRWDDGVVSTELFVMNADGGGVRNLTREWGLDGDALWSSPVLSPNGKRFLFESRRKGRYVPGLGATGMRDVSTMNVGGAGQRWLARGITRVHLGRTTEDQTTTPGLNPGPVWSPDGRKIAFISNRDGWWCPTRRDARCDSEIYVMNADGSGQRNLSRRQGFDTSPVWSPDGRSIAFVHSGNARGQPYHQSEIYVVNADGRGQRNLTSGPGGGSAPSWSPDGRKIAFRSDRDGNGELYLMNVDGSGLARLTRNPASDGDPIWSRDGRKIFFVRARRGKCDIWTTNADGSRQRNLSGSAPRRNPCNTAPALSPDGREIVFASRGDGSPEIYVMNADGSEIRRLT
jgi:Tol biopolymer transport system component